MLKSTKTRAEEKFAATQKKHDQVMKKKEKDRQKELEHTASLRALRLAKEAADKEAADAAAAEKAAAAAEKAAGKRKKVAAGRK